MENVTFGVAQTFSPLQANSAGTGALNEQQRIAAQAPQGPEQTAAVQLNQDIPTTNQVDTVTNQTQVQTNQTNNAEPALQPQPPQPNVQAEAVQQAQIETALSEITGIDVQEFEGIELDAALDLQESLRNRPETTLTQAQEQDFAPAPAAFDAPGADDATAQQQTQDQLQVRLAAQIPTDPFAEFPPLVDTTA